MTVEVDVKADVVAIEVVRDVEIDEEVDAEVVAIEVCGCEASDCCALPVTAIEVAEADAFTEVEGTELVFPDVAVP